jgi:DNA-binding NarL/FixJ family response regulator
MPDAPITVVLADDHPIFRDGVRGILGLASDFELVGEAGDGVDAVKLTLARRPDLLLLDLALPDMSGNEVLRRLREEGCRTATLLVTGAIDREQTLEALHLGARGVVMKSSASEVLLKAMRAVARGEYWVGHRTMADWTEYAREHGQPRQLLTAREQEVLRHVLDGLSNRDIGRTLGVSEETVKSHVSNIYRKLGVSNRMELALYVATGKLKSEP